MSLPTESPKIVAKGLRAITAAAGSVERWCLDNPTRKNAVTPAALEWMTQRCEALEGQVVVLSGLEGPFCAGFDLTELAAALDREGAFVPDAPLIEATEAMISANATFVAAIARYAIGAGVELAATCDFRLFATGSWLQVPAGRLGVVYHPGGLRRIHAAFGPQVAARLLLAGERVPCEQLDYGRGLSGVVEPDGLEGAAAALAASIAAQDTHSVRYNRRLLRALDRPAMGPELLAAHERARVEAYARAKSRQSD